MQNTFWYFYALSVLPLGVQPLNCLYSPQFELYCFKSFAIGHDDLLNTKEWAKETMDLVRGFQCSNPT